MRNAQITVAHVKALDPQLAGIALKQIANHKSAALEPQLPFAQPVEKIHQEDITRTHIDRHKLTFQPHLIISPLRWITSHQMTYQQWSKILLTG